MSRFEEFEAYVRVVEAGSVTAAAAQMNIAKSAVSRRLKELESRLGVQLMTRTTRQLTLTDSGKALYDRALALLADWNEAECVVSSASTELSGLLKIAASVSFGVTHLGPAILDFMELHPGVEFDVDFNDRKIDLIAEGRDLAIRIGDLQDSSLIARRLAPVRMVLCASPKFIEKFGLPETPEDLEALHELRYSHRAQSNWRFVGPDGVEGIMKMKCKLAATNGEFLRDAALRGEGVLIEPSFIIYNELRNGSLVELMPDYAWGSVSIHAVYPPTRHLSSRVRSFVDFLVDRYNGEPYWEAC